MSKETKNVKRKRPSFTTPTPEFMEHFSTFPRISVYFIKIDFHEDISCYLDRTDHIDASDKKKSQVA